MHDDWVIWGFGDQDRSQRSSGTHPFAIESCFVFLSQWVMHDCRADGHFWSGVLPVVFRSNESFAGVVLQLSEPRGILSTIPTDLVEMVARESAGIVLCCRVARYALGGDGLQPDAEATTKNRSKITTDDACGFHHRCLGTALANWKEFGGSGASLDPVSSLARLVGRNSVR